MTGLLGRILPVLVAMCLAGPALAADDPACPEASSVLRPHGGLPHGRQAIAAGEPLRIVLVGTQGSIRSERGGPEPGYADRITEAIRASVPAARVAVDVHTTTGRTTEEMAGEIRAVVTALRPNLVVWQTGTVDAMRGVELDGFSAALDRGIAAASTGNADLVLVNLAYTGPRMPRMPTDYVKYMLWSAQSGGAPLVDRYAMMKAMAEAGAVDLRATTDEGRRTVVQTVNRCLAEVIGRFVAAEIRSPP